MENEFKLNRNEEQFIDYLIQNYSIRDAYKLAFRIPENVPYSYCSTKASTLLHRPDVQAYYNKLKQEIKERTLEKIVWDRAEAIKNIKEVMESNQKEMNRYQEAYIEEITYYNQKIEEIEEILRDREKKNKSNPNRYIGKKKQAELEQKLDQLKFERIKVNRRHQANKNVNEGILNAINQLNEMSGIDKPEGQDATNVNVMFVDNLTALNKNTEDNVNT